MMGGCPPEKNIAARFVKAQLSAQLTKDTISEGPACVWRKHNSKRHMPPRSTAALFTRAKTEAT